MAWLTALSSMRKVVWHFVLALLPNKLKSNQRAKPNLCEQFKHLMNINNKPVNRSQCQISNWSDHVHVKQYLDIVKLLQYPPFIISLETFIAYSLRKSLNLWFSLLHNLQISSFFSSISIKLFKDFSFMIHCLKYLSNKPLTSIIYPSLFCQRGNTKVNKEVESQTSENLRILTI